MSSIGNKVVFSKNLRELMNQKGKDRNKVCADLRTKIRVLGRVVKVEFMAK